MSSVTPIPPSSPDIAEELALLAFRASILDGAMETLAPLVDPRVNPPELLRHRISTLIYYLCGYTIVHTYGHTRQAMTIYREFRSRSMENYSKLLQTDVDDTAKVYADFLRRNDPEYSTVAMAEAFVAIANESNSDKLKPALLPLIESFRQEISRTLDGIVHKPVIRNPIPREVSPDEVEKMKQELLAAGPGWYDHLFAQLSHPASQMMLALLPDGRRRWDRIQMFGSLGVVCWFAAAVLPFLGLWPLSLVVLAIWYFGLTKAREEAVYDIAARLFTLNKELRTLDRPLLGKRA